MSASTPAGKAQEYAPIATEPKAPTMRERQLVLLEQRLQLLRDLGLNTVKAEEVATRTRLPFVPPVAESAKLRSSRAKQNQRAWRATKSFLVQEPGLDAESLSVSVSRGILRSALEHKKVRIRITYNKLEMATDLLSLLRLDAGDSDTEEEGEEEEGAAGVPPLEEEEEGEEVDVTCVLSSCQCPALFAEAVGNTPILCGVHADPTWPNVVHSRCAGGDVEGCHKFSTHALPGNPRRYCSIHADEGMENVVNKRCEVEGCGKLSPTYGPPGGRRMFCSGHAGPGDVNLMTKRKTVADEDSDWEGPEKRRKAAAVSDDGGDVGGDVRSSIVCTAPFCGVRAGFGAPGASAPVLCRRHKQTGMVRVYVGAPPPPPALELGQKRSRDEAPEGNVHADKCEANYCREVGPSWGKRGGRMRFCAGHARPGDVFLRKRAADDDDDDDGAPPPPKMVRRPVVRAPAAAPPAPPPPPPPEEEPPADWITQAVADATAAARRRVWVGGVASAPGSPPRPDGEVVEKEGVVNVSPAAAPQIDTYEACVAALELPDPPGEAYYNLAVCYEFERGVPQNLPSAVRLYQIAAETGHTLSQRRVGQWLLEGGSVQFNRAEAVTWFKRAADAGDAISLFHVGHALVHGMGVRADPPAGVEFLRRAAEGGSAPAMELLGWCYRNGRGVEDRRAS